MFTRLASVIALAVCASASVFPPTECNTGPIQCCDSMQSPASPQVASLLGLLGIPLGSVAGQVGVACNPVNVIGAGGNSCNSQPACCKNNNYNGVVALDCTPLNLNL